MFARWNWIQWFYVALLALKKNVLKDLVFFLDKKKARVCTFKQLFHEGIADLSCMKGNDSVNKFIELLVSCKERPKAIAMMYESIMNEPASEMVRGLLSMYEREIRKYS